MLLGFFTVAVMLIVAYAYWREGLLTACTMFVNVFLAGLVAFNFFEPLANLLEPAFADNFLRGWEDGLCLMVLFSLTLGFLRLVTNSIAPTDLHYPPVLLRAGGVFFGVATGYLASGIIICILQTLPWHEHFMGFEAKYDPSVVGGGMRNVLPPDRVWLALAQRAGAYAFANFEDEDVKEPQKREERYRTFDKYSTFELRYARYRRYNDDREALPDLGDFDRQVHRKRN
jgi:hypothetical protein